MWEPERYCAFYCEENIWQLCRRIGDEASDALDAAEVAFIASNGDAFAIWHQRAAPPGEILAWDYHVVLLRPAGAGGVELWDLDTRLPCPIGLDDYLTQSFGGLEALAERWQPRFRVLPATHYLVELSTDRRHMREGDGWKKPPPPWDPPFAEARGHNLDSFRSMESGGPGELFDLAGLRARYS